MNLHEECLLKYLINPLELFYTTELLKQNMILPDKDDAEIKNYTKNVEINYNRV